MRSSSDYSFNILNKIVAMCAGLAVSAMLARHLGVVLRGEYGFVTATATTLALVLGLGFNQAFPYFFKNDAPGVKTYDNFVRIYLIQFVVLAGIAVIASALNLSTTVALIALLTPVLVLYQQSEGAMAVVDVRLKIRLNIALAVLRVVGVAIIVIALPVSLLWPIALQAVLWLSVSVSYLGLTGVWLGTRTSPAYVKAIARFSWLPMITSVLVVLNYNIDTFLLKWLGTPEDLGYYTVAAGVVIYLWAFPDAIKEVLISRVARSSDATRFLLPLKAGILVSIVCVVAFVGLGKPAVGLVFGEKFLPSYSLGVILSLGVVSMTLYKVIGVILLADGKRYFYFGILLLAVLSNTALNVWLIPLFGAAGAAWSSVASYSFTGICFVVYFLRQYRLKARSLLIRRADVAKMVSIFR